MFNIGPLTAKRRNLSLKINLYLSYIFLRKKIYYIYDLYLIIPIYTNDIYKFLYNF